MTGLLDVAVKIIGVLAGIIAIAWAVYQFATRNRPKTVIPILPSASPQPIPHTTEEVASGIGSARPAGAAVQIEETQGVELDWPPERNHYEQALLDWQNPTGNEQNLVVVATYGCQARSFESDQQMALARLLVQYMDARRDGVTPTTWQDTVWFDAVSRSGRGMLRARIYADGAIVLSLTETFGAIPWDWALAEGYLMLKALQDHSLRETFVASTKTEFMMILGQIPAGGITLKGLRGPLSGVEPATPADYSRNTIRRPYVLATDTDPWETAVQFTKTLWPTPGIGTLRGT